jgi:hypothetical protein
MSMTSILRRATLLGLAAGTAGCDLAQLVSEPAPRFRQTWNVPADSASISVGTLLPPNVTIYSTPASSPPDSSAFLVNMNLLPVSRRVGDDCAQCNTLDGTTDIKPAFVLVTGSTTTLPTDMVSGALLGGDVMVDITNTMSFDPLRVKTGPGAQGYMIIVVRSGSLVIARDSVNGATTPLAPGSVLSRPMALQTGIVTGTIAVDITVNSPVGDTPVPIDASGRLNASATVTDLRFTQVRINVANRTLQSPGTDSLPLDDLGEDITKYVQSATLAMTISNPFAVTGNVDVSFGYGTPTQLLSKATTMPTGANQYRSITLDANEVRSLFGHKVALSITGDVSSTAPIDITPRQVIVIANRLVLEVLTGGGN